MNCQARGDEALHLVDWNFLIYSFSFPTAFPVLYRYCGFFSYFLGSAAVKSIAATFWELARLHPSYKTKSFDCL